MNEYHITDHETIRVDLLTKKASPTQKNKCISWKNYSKKLLIDELRMANWNLFEKMSIEQKAICLKRQYNKFGFMK